MTGAGRKQRRHRLPRPHIQRLAGRDRQPVRLAVGAGRRVEVDVGLGAEMLDMGDDGGQCRVTGAAVLVRPKAEMLGSDP